MKEYGGTTAQLATNQESLFVVYSGTTTRRSSPNESKIFSDGARTALDIKRIIEKTGFDIIRPQWIHDCVRKGELVLLRKKYFFHASPARIEDGEYDLSESEDESAISSNLKDEDEVARVLETSKASGPELESEHSEWFKVEPGNPRISGDIDDSETEEDNGSDNHDFEEPDTVEDDDSDEWFTIPRENQVKGQVKVESSVTMGTQSSEGFNVAESPQNQDTTIGFSPSAIFTNFDPNIQVKLEIKEEEKMGEDDSAMQYDQEMIFKHLYVFHNPFPLFPF